MKKFAFATVTCALASIAVILSVHAADVVKTGTTQPSTKPVAINQFCAIETDNKVDPNAETYLYKGKVIGFCCPDCIDTFKKDPEKYMAKLK